MHIFILINKKIKSIYFKKKKINVIPVPDSVGAPSGTGVQPPVYPPPSQQPPFPIYVIPYPLPIVPSPASCPCYLLNPGQNNQQSSPQMQYNQYPYQGYQPYGIIGFIPVVFVPNCPGNNTGMQTAQQNFPNAVSVPYNCGQCQASNDIYRYFGRLNGGRSIEMNDLKEIKSLPELENLLKNQIKPPRKSLRRIAVNARVLDDMTNDKKNKKNLIIKAKED